MLQGVVGKRPLMDTRPRENSVQPSGVSKGLLRAAQTLRQESRSKSSGTCRRRGEENERSLPGLGGVLLKAEGGPDALEGPLTSTWVPSNEYYQPSSPFLGRRHKGSARTGVEVPPKAPKPGVFIIHEPDWPAVCPELPSLA